VANTTTPLSVRYWLSVAAQSSRTRDERASGSSTEVKKIKGGKAAYKQRNSASKTHDTIALSIGQALHRVK